MLAEFLNEPLYGYEMWKVLVFLACIGILSVVSWVATLVWIWRSSMTRDQKAVASCLIVAGGPLNALAMVVFLPLDMLLKWARSRRQADGTCHSRHISR
ncbi:MAG: hypothetical protein HZB16_18080, partial [Armatimonadetes bacterium]|nr:hypothetical protein [Armatimonadota bacterium]